MKQFVKIGLLLVTLVICTGMGSVGGYPEGTIPETDVRIQATVIDRSETQSNLNQFSMDGKTHISAWRGKGQMTVPFEHIETITFGVVKGATVEAEVKLKSCTVLDLSVRSRAQFYGSTGFGAFKVKARDIARISFP